MTKRKTMDVSDFTTEEDAGKKLITPVKAEGKVATKKARPIDALGLSKKPDKKAMTVYFQEDERKAIKAAADRLERPKSEIVRASVRMALGLDPAEE